MQEKGRRRSRYQEPRVNRGAVLLIVGAVVLLLISGGLIVAMLREGPPAQASTPAPTPAVVAAAIEPTATVEATATAIPATATATTRPPTVTATVRSATAVPTAAPRATPPSQTVRAGGCAMSLPTNFAEEKPGGGYYPALDRTGFVALDPFDTNGGQRSTADVTQGFIEGTLKLALQDYRQTALVQTDDGSRIDYTARAGEKNGRGVVVVRRIGNLTCGVTLFALSDSPIAFNQTLDFLLSSLQPARL